ncbi:Molybdopterin or thiamine biosynthesis adenylyltransferase [Bradyrhizobium sp. Ghvi]|uniref:ThiF family adenylyltransferase n=1 Tax=Bradyrhizobium sp. Ghvi TaxID=1855319 RepID=UPI0008E1EEA4|nr:ThiF family adenylyltransferase [Bradyrhizobium sp. Ghvi]SFQ30432.1 Molybdopterin or thiamine biosynthesis adenylyltransferase [Bradyrhizobium sp. Ghvi]
MITTLVLTEPLFQELEQTARLPVETAGVLLAGMARAPNGDIRLLGRAMHWVPQDAYLAREGDHLSIASHGYVPALAEAERLGAIPIWFHTHPGIGSHPTPSMADRKVDQDIADLFRLRSGSELYITLIASPRENGITFTGEVNFSDGDKAPIDRLWRVGDKWQLINSFNSTDQQIPEIFDRSVRAFGPEIQQTLGALRIGIVGCGGTGSAVAEQLVRLGIRHLTVIDADTLTESNVTRVYGSTPAAVGKPKTAVLQSHLTAIAPDLECKAVGAMVTLEKTARELIPCDIVFGCTDDNAGRLVLSRLSTFLAMPVIDLGVLLGGDGALASINGRVTTLAPGGACLVCRDRIDLARAQTELRTPEERIRLENEGYAPVLGGVEPAVVTFTTGIASAAINELLERLIGFGPSPRPTEVLFRWHEREISTNNAKPRPQHYCDPESHKIGKGESNPFLEQAWPEA